MTESIDAKIEFEVKDLTPEKVHTIKSVLKEFSGITRIEDDLNNKKIYVETSLPTSIVHKNIEKSANSETILKGMGTPQSMKHLEAAVAEMYDLNMNPCGLIRFVQLDNDLCAIDGTIDDLTNGEHALNIFEYGDISDSFNKTGGHFNPHKSIHGLPSDHEKHAGDLGDITAGTDGTATFRFVDKMIKTWDVIGRTICVSENPHSRQEINQGAKVACGIIARSAVISENVKKICACSGKTMWQERKIEKSKI